MKLRYSVAKSQRTFKKYISEMRQFDLREEYRSGYDNLITYGSGFRDIISMAIVRKIYHPGTTASIGVAIRLKTGTRAMYRCDITCFVKPEFRGRGIGSKLVNLLITPEELDISSNQFPIGFPKDERTSAIPTR